jgi:flavodoxin/NAD-dependent dihydropyrimidine dehydrogenase PreA subunit
LKSIIIYFSQTGNTEKVAKAIQSGIAQMAGQCDQKSIREANPVRLGDYDLIGFGSPVIGQCPANVIDFVSRIRSVGGKHAFAFCTHGTGHRRFFPSLYPVLTGRGLTVIGSADWYGNCYLLHMPQPYPTAGHPDATDLEQAEAFGREMALRSMRIAAGEMHLIPPAPEELAPLGPPPSAGKGPEAVVRTFSGLLQFHREKCLYPNCTLCMDNCPTYGLDLSLDPPVLADNCIDCEFCARLCPTGALDMLPWLEAMEEMTVSFMPRMLESLEKAETEGQFRRLIPLSEIDTTRTGYRQYTAHPQWILGKGAQRGANRGE